MTNEKGSLIVITGPTAVGKTELSVALAKKQAAKSYLPIPFRYISI